MTASTRPQITGLTFIRRSGRNADRAESEGERPVVMFVALLAVPEGFELKTEHQYVTTGEVTPEGDVQLHLHADGEVDISEQTKGMRPDQILCSSVWRT